MKLMSHYQPIMEPYTLNQITPSNWTVLFIGTNNERTVIMKIKIEIEMSVDQSVKCLLETLDMLWINDPGDFEIKNGSVYKNGELYDDRADLFAALRNLETQLYPNLEFRSDPYITNYSDGEDEDID